jgi:hypothetical protein
MRDPSRPPAHPLVEMVYDVRAALDRTEPGATGHTSPATLVYRRLRETLHSARRLVDALELVVADLEARSDGDPDERSKEKEAGDGDFQRIRVR